MRPHLLPKELPSQVDAFVAPALPQSVPLEPAIGPLSEPREIWVGVHLPQLAADPKDQPGDERRRRQVLQGLATSAQRFTPRVSLAPPDALLLEVKGSLHLFGGAAGMRCALEALLQSSGVAAELAFAPTPLAALALARAGQRIEVLDPARLVSRVAPLALASLRWPGKVVERLAKMGVYTIGQALRLPRAGLARRCGVAQLASLDRLTGHAADSPARFYPRERFRRRRELIYELGDQALILKMLQPSLQQLAGFLQTRQCGISRLECRLRHRHAPVTLCVLKLAEPTADEQRLSGLLGEKLLSLVLPEPVRSYELRSGWLVPRAMSSHPLWRPAEQGGTAGPASPQLVEHLRARLGDEAVYGLQVLAGHRPEKMWCLSEPGMHAVTQPCAAFRRPLWLLPAPQLLAENAGLPQYRGTLQLLGTPERIETGWWDGGEVLRDYYTALDTHGVRLWIFRERSEPHRWFLHGVFG